MSSSEPKFGVSESWLILAVCLTMTTWYAIPQLLYSLAPVYQLARALCPGIIPEVNP